MPEINIYLSERQAYALERLASIHHVVSYPLAVNGEESLTSAEMSDLMQRFENVLHPERAMEKLRAAVEEA